MTPPPNFHTTTNMLSIALRRLQPSGANRLSRLFSSTTVKRSGNTAGSLADVCDLNIVSSPFPPILDSSHYPPVPEFVSANWKDPKWADKVAIRDGSTGETRTFSDYRKTM